MTRVFITKTEGEWKAIELTLSELRKKAGLPSYVRNECSRLVREFKDCPDCITVADGEKKKWTFCIPDDEYEEISKIAKKMQITVSSVIDDLVISPLLLPK